MTINYRSNSEIEDADLKYVTECPTCKHVFLNRKRYSLHRKKKHPEEIERLRH